MLEPPDPIRREFTIGRVLSLAWRGFRRHFAIVTALCLAGGVVGAPGEMAQVFD